MVGGVFMAFDVLVGGLLGLVGFAVPGLLFTRKSKA